MALATRSACAMHGGMITWYSSAQIGPCVSAGISRLPGCVNGVWYVARVGADRLLLALALSILLTPLLAHKMPILPENPLALFVLMLGEILIGIFLGLIVIGLVGLQWD